MSKVNRISFRFDRLVYPVAVDLMPTGQNMMANNKYQAKQCITFSSAQQLIFIYCNPHRFDTTI